MSHDRPALYESIQKQFVIVLFSFACFHDRIDWMPDGSGSFWLDRRSITIDLLEYCKRGSCKYRAGAIDVYSTGLYMYRK